ncbi:MAG: hypothetical protein VKO39_01905 [Cyanobacteriota bacterium]|nr:hypothetical protein [Cyanobacteriota bacterium]
MRSPLSRDDDPLVLALPDDALNLADRVPAETTPRGLAVHALQEHMAALGLSLPLGPALALHDPARLLVLNGFRVQLVCAPCGSDRLSVDSGPWRQAARAPHFLLAAWVDDDLPLVWMPGALTNGEVIDQAAVTSDGTALELALEHVHGGVDRLLSLVRLLDPQAMPLRGLECAGAAAAAPEPLPINRWLRGQIDAALLALGAHLLPADGAVFRAAPLAGADRDALAVLAIPLGVANDGLCWGEARAGAIERFQLRLIACGDGGAAPRALRVRLVPQLAGDVLPDGLRLVAGPRAAVSAISQGLELEVSGSATPIQIAVEWRGTQLRLPPLLLWPTDSPEAAAEPDADR